MPTVALPVISAITPGVLIVGQMGLRLTTAAHRREPARRSAMAMRPCSGWSAGTATTPKTPRSSSRAVPA
jgi:hypothetical protein